MFCRDHFFSRRKHMNQSRQYMLGSSDSTRSLAVPQDPAVGTMTSSPGLQSAGVAQLSLSAFWSAMITLLISSKFLPSESG